MPGVEILNTTIYYKDVLPTWAIIFIIAVLAIPMILIIIGKTFDIDSIFRYGVIFLVIGVLACVAVCLLTCQPANTIDYIEHEAFIDDSVSFVEFNKKYNVIDQKGKIYIIREKGKWKLKRSIAYEDNNCIDCAYATFNIMYRNHYIDANIDNTKSRKISIK